MSFEKEEEIDFNPEEFMKIKSKKPLPKLTKFILIFLICFTVFSIWTWNSHFEPEELVNFDLLFLNIDKQKVMDIAYTITPPALIEKEKKIYWFTHNNKEYRIELNVSSELFLYFEKSRKAMQAEAWKSMIKEERRKLIQTRYIFQPDWFYLLLLENDLDNQIIENLIKQLSNLEPNMSDKEKVNMVISFVQNLKYDLNVAADGTFYPYETLYLQKGVCDDDSILLGKILNRMNYDVALIEMRKIHHMALGIKCEGGPIELKGYCYIETTSPSPILYQKPPGIGETLIYKIKGGKKVY